MENGRFPQSSMSVNEEPVKLTYYRNPSLDPEQNLQLEEDLFSLYRENDFLMLWQNEPAVIIGRNQDEEEEVDLSFAKSMGIRIVKRSTGGGAVYHDLGNVNFSFFTDLPAGETYSLKQLAKPIADAIGFIGVPVHFSGRNDLLTEDGRKICGTAARVNGDRILFHGCICYDVDQEVMDRVLTPGADKLVRHGIRSVRSRTARLRDYFPQMDTGAFMDRLENELLRNFKRSELLLRLTDISGTMAGMKGR
jgi:lipoate-protein ligase A